MIQKKDIIGKRVIKLRLECLNSNFFKGEIASFDQMPKIVIYVYFRIKNAMKR